MTHRRPRSRDVLVSAAPLLAAVPLLLRRMQWELRATGTFRSATAGLIWVAYGLHATVEAAALAARPVGPRLPAGARFTAAGAALIGGALYVLGSGRFAGPGHLTGTDAGDLITGGTYRYSRNPQYVGLVALYAGLAVARRSPTALLLAAGLAGTFRAWVPVEERHLAEHFGPPYERYRSATTRWLGRPRKVRSGHLVVSGGGGARSGAAACLPLPFVPASPRSQQASRPPPGRRSWLSGWSRRSLAPHCADWDAITVAGSAAAGGALILYRQIRQGLVFYCVRKRHSSCVTRLGAVSTLS